MGAQNAAGTTVINTRETKVERRILRKQILKSSVVIETWGSWKGRQRLRSQQWDSNEPWYCALRLTGQHLKRNEKGCRTGGLECAVFKLLCYPLWERPLETIESVTWYYACSLFKLNIITQNGEYNDERTRLLCAITWTITYSGFSNS